MLTVYAREDKVFESICNGACGYLLKDTPPARLLEAIREAHRVEAPGMPPGTTAYGGIAGGYMLQFSTGLTVYLTGDTGLFTDMEVLARFYRPGVVVMNIGDVGTLGPTEAAFALQHLIKGKVTVMPSHLYEEATEHGSVRPGSRLETFMGLVRGFVDVVVPLSNVTRSFDQDGRCVDCR